MEQAAELCQYVCTWSGLRDEVVKDTDKTSGLWKSLSVICSPWTFAEAEASPACACTVSVVHTACCRRGGRCRRAATTEHGLHLSHHNTSLESCPASILARQLTSTAANQVDQSRR